MRRHLILFPVFYEHHETRSRLRFLPLYIFCGHHLLLAQLRPGNIDGARGSRNVIRREALQNTPLAKAVPSTIRLKLLKVGARVINSVRQVKISMPDAYPYKDIFFKAHAVLAPT